jgi:hypothetical protein
MEDELLEIISIDESGITALTGHSVYAFVHIRIKDYVSISQFIIKTEKELDLDYIHRSDMSWDIRLKLARRLVCLNFRINAIVHKNPIRPDNALEQSLIKMYAQMKHSYKIFIDGKKSRHYHSKINRILKSQGDKTYKVKFVSDTSEPALRLADFVAGSIRSYIDHPENKKTEAVYRTLKCKIETQQKIK